MNIFVFLTGLFCCSDIDVINWRKKKKKLSTIISKTAFPLIDINSRENGELFHPNNLENYTFLSIDLSLLIDLQFHSNSQLYNPCNRTLSCCLFRLKKYLVDIFVLPQFLPCNSDLLDI